MELTDRIMVCVICGDSIDLHKSSEYVTLTEKGCVAINKASHNRNLNIPDIKFTDHCNIYGKQPRNVNVYQSKDPDW